MRVKSILATLTIFAFSLVLSSCARGGGIGGGGSYRNDLKQIQQQRSGEYVITALNETGQLKQGQNKFALEFRRASDNQLADAGNVQVNSTMPMPGMSPMIAQTSVTPSDMKGVYNVSSNFSMAGTWNFIVSFGNGQRAQFSFRVQ